MHNLFEPIVSMYVYHGLGAAHPPPHYWVKGKVFEVDASLTIFQQRQLAVRMCAKQVA